MKAGLIKQPDQCQTGINSVGLLVYLDAAVSKHDFCYRLISNESWSMNPLIGARVALIYKRQCKPSFPCDLACNLYSLIIVLHIDCQYSFCWLMVFSLPGLEN